MVGEENARERRAPHRSTEHAQTLCCSAQQGVKEGRTLVEIEVVASGNNTTFIHVFFSFSAFSPK